MTKNTEFKKWLRKHDACSPAMEWLGDRTPEQTYKECTRASWLLWWFARAHEEGLQGYPTIEQLRKCALEIARKTLQFNNDERLKNGLDKVEEYLSTGNKDTLTEGRNMIKAARASAWSRYINADAAAYAAVADARKNETQAAQQLARDKMNKECADIVRTICGELKFEQCASAVK